MALPRNIVVIGLFENKTLNLNVDAPVHVGEVKEYFTQRKCVDWTLFSLTRGGVILGDSDTVGECAITVLHAHPLLKGGKGGFGSLIRAMGSQINKSTNKEACRNLSGRRVRDINAEKKLAKWAAGEPERKRREAEDKMQRLERKRAGPKHSFDDAGYMEQIKSTEEEMSGALKQGLEASSSGSNKGKCKAVETDRPRKRPKLWLGVEEDLSDSEGEDEEPELPPESLQTEEGNGSLSDEPVIDTESDPLPCPGSSAQKCATPSLPSDSGGSNESDQKATDGSDHKHGSAQVQANQDFEPIDLGIYESAEELVSVGGERLKAALQSLGLKCGGTPMQRASRLFSTKGKTMEELDSSLFAKPKKSKKLN